MLTEHQLKSIAEFDGIILDNPNGRRVSIDEFQYNTDWNLIMRLVHKIEDIKIIGMGVAVFINTKSITIKPASISSCLIQLCQHESYFYDREEEYPELQVVQRVVHFNTHDQQRENLLTAIYEFVIWYNENKHKCK